MKEVVIVEAVRTPVGNHGGVFRDVDSKELARTVIKGVLDRTKIDPASIDEVIFGCIAQPSDAPNITRVAALMVSIPQVPLTLCPHRIGHGRDCAGLPQHPGGRRRDQFPGVESMSNIPYIVKGARWGLKIRHSQFTDAMWEGLTDPICGQLMGRTAENLAEEFEISRQAQDEYAVQSHKKAFMAT
jgi:acetyl-CoA C-acetyltransferase